MLHSLSGTESLTKLGQQTYLDPASLLTVGACVRVC